tara:strand:+ start:88 stop:582 length:495 start_codon:yes stop_codon:yes gene_type:complete
MSNTKILGIILIGLLVIAVVLGVVQFNNNKDITLRLSQKSPLPENIEFDMESQSPYKDLIGVWSGTWARNNPALAMTTTLVIRSIDEADVATVIYSWGNNDELGVIEGYIETIAQIEGKVIDVKMRNPLKLIYLFEDDGREGRRLHGFFDNGFTAVSGVIKKQK